jgi:hypothetical protein
MGLRYIDEQPAGKLRYIDEPAKEEDTATKVAASAPVQFAVGVAEPVLGMVQRLGSGNQYIRQAFPILSTLAAAAKPAVDESLAGFNQMSQAGDASSIPRIAGNILSPASLGAGKIDIPSSLLGKIGLGASVGGMGGFVAPAASEEQARQNALIGSAIGGAIPGAVAGVGKAYDVASNQARQIFDLFTKEGPTNIIRRYINSPKVVGEQNMPAVLQKTANPQQILPSSRPTVSQATAGVPEASPLVALEDIVAKTGGGPSAKFGARIREQDFAKEVAEGTRDTFTSPMRDVALSAANKTGINVGPILKEIDALASKPGDRASDVVQKTLGSVRDKIQALGSNGPIDARDLYTVRKEVGNTIQSFAKESSNWDKKLTSKLEREIQLKIDDAIEAAGGTGWKAYLQEYASRSKAIDADVARRELSRNPLQPTNLGGGLNVGEETRPHLPNLLSRPAMVANFLMRKAGHGVEPKIDAKLAEMMLDPFEFTRVMSQLPPKTQTDLRNALQRANVLSFGTANSLRSQ